MATCEIIDSGRVYSSHFKAYSYGTGNTYTQHSELRAVIKKNYKNGDRAQLIKVFANEDFDSDTYMNRGRIFATLKYPDGKFLVINLEGIRIDSHLAPLKHMKKHTLYGRT